MRIDSRPAKLVLNVAQLEKGCTTKLKTMKKRIALIGSALLFLAFCAAQAGTLFTSPIIFVQPQKLDFGKVQRTKFATNSFIIENVGAGVMTGKATVAPPFKIISGESYQLKRSEIQVVKIVYSPDTAGTNKETVTFTGAATPVTVTVTGKLDPRPPRYVRKNK